jgi:hypothetical protein
MSKENVDATVSLIRGKEARQIGQAILAINALSISDIFDVFKSLTPEELKSFKEAAFDGIPGGWCQGTRPLVQSMQVNIDRLDFAYRVAVGGKIPAKIPGDLYETGQLKDAYRFLNLAPPTKAVWLTVIGSVCEDARLRKKGEEGSLITSPTIMASDTTTGQAGWDIGIMYGSGQANSVVPGKIKEKCNGFLLRRVGLSAHGDPGLFAINGVDEKMNPIDPPMKADDSLMGTFGNLLRFLNNVMIDDGILLLHGCSAGSRDNGSRLLMQLSNALRPRKVVAFKTVGFQSVEKQRRGADQCREPGARDTPYYGNASGDEQYNRYFKDGQWDDLKALPWQSETSPHAKIAQNGVIIQGNEDY